MQGHDLAPLLRGQTPSDWRQDFLYQFKWSSEIIPASEGVCSKEWKYIRWIVTGTEELFNVRDDSSEIHNLASDLTHAADLDRLRSRLAALKQEIGGAPLEQLQNLPFGEPRKSPAAAKAKK
jgi:hypothetical protein